MAQEAPQQDRVCSYTSKASAEGSTDGAQVVRALVRELLPFDAPHNSAGFNSGAEPARRSTVSQWRWVAS